MNRQTVLRKTLIIASLVFTVFVNGLQAAPQVPAGLQPGVTEKQFQPQPKPKSTRKLILPTPAEQMAPDDAIRVKFVLRQLQISGSTIFSKEDLQPLYSDLLGLEVSLKTIFDIAGAITRRYSKAGYALSVAYVPAQEIDASGLVSIVVTEGYIAEIEYTGEVDALSLRNRRRLEALTIERPLTVATLERQLLLINDSPGTTISTTLDRGEIGVGATKLIVNVVSKKYDIYGDLNNRGSISEGRGRYDLGGAVNNIFGYDDRVTASYKRTFDKDEQEYYAIGYHRLLNDRGTTLELDFDTSSGEPGLAVLKKLDYKTESSIYQIGISHPLKRSRSQNLSLFARLCINDNDSEIIGIKISESNIRSLRVGIDFDFIDRFSGQTWVRMTFSQGLDFLDATDQNSDLNIRADADYTYTAVRADLFRTQMLNQSFSYFAQAAVQIAADPLVANEQCGYGGGFFGRAYDSSEISGDHAAMAGIELRWHAPVIVDKINSLDPYLFWSGGRTWLKGGENNSAHDIGFGVRLQAYQHHDLYVELAQPLNRDVTLEENRNARIFCGWRVSY